MAKAGGHRGAPQGPGEDRGAEAPSAALSAPPSAARAESGLDFRLREAITVEISTFLVALDDAIGEGKAESLQRLREATDRLLRAAARIRIELERPPDGTGKGSTATPPRR